MAAKQGISATITQTSADAISNTISRLPSNIRSHTWLSNLNTTCTIKSAPPRTPEVMTLLSTHSGYLVKRNEQHVWQKRWCCVVPHTFLYYFDAEKEGDPVGIIDLECYTSVNHGRDYIWELTGDAITNPDLRSFWFQGNSEEDCELWTKALLGERHGALRDERDAYHQVCETFPLQLSHLSDEIDDAKSEKEEVEKELYRVRSQVEEGRRQVLRIVRETLEYAGGRWVDGLERELGSAEAVGMNGGVTKAVGILADCCGHFMGEKKKLGEDNERMMRQLDYQNKAKCDVSELEGLKRQMDDWKKRHSQERRRMEERVANLENLLQQTRDERDSYSKNLEAKEMEFNLLSAASKQRIHELSGHKKILKREVIDLRKKIDEIVSEVSAYKHRSLGLDEKVKAEKERNQILERHLNQVESQIKMQERLMDCMMSQSGSMAGSVCFNDNQSIVSDLKNEMLSIRSEIKIPPRRYPPSYGTAPSSVANSISNVPRPTSTNTTKEKMDKKKEVIDTENILRRSTPSFETSIDDNIPRVGPSHSSGNSTTQAANINPDIEQKEPTPPVAVFDSTTPVSSPDMIQTKEQHQQTQLKPAIITKDQIYPPFEAHHHTISADDDSSQGSMSALTEDRTQTGSSIALSTPMNNTPPTKIYPLSRFTHTTDEQPIEVRQIDEPNQPPNPKSHSAIPSLVSEDSCIPSVKRALPPSAPTKPNEQRLTLPPPRLHRRQNSFSSQISRDDASVSSSSSRLSVAQRARLEADSSSCSVKVKNPIDRVPPPRKNNSLFGNWGQSILGVKNDNPETKTSLKERQAIQRQKQLKFLKEQGLLQEDRMGGHRSVSSMNSVPNGVYQGKIESTNSQE